MGAVKTMTRGGVLIGIAMFVATACSSGVGRSATSPNNTGAVPTTSTVASSGQPDPLVGIWESDPVTAADVDANWRDTFSASAVDQMEGIHNCYPKEGHTLVVTLHFGGGQLVISDSVNGAPSREEWTGSYAVQGSDSFAAGDATNLYITVDYTIEGDRLSTNLIKDRLPDHSPWSAAQDGAQTATLTIGKPLADTLCQSWIYETTPFTKVG